MSDSATHRAPIAFCGASAALSPNTFSARHLPANFYEPQFSITQRQEYPGQRTERILDSAPYKSVEVRTDRVAKIQASPALGAGAPSPGPTAGEAPRPAAPVRAYQQPQRKPSPTLQQPSPLTQHSPSTVEASPLQTPGPPAADGSAEATGRRPEGRMRAQIACTRCRRSKTKCDNQGVGSVCKSCDLNKKQCEYQDALATPMGSGSYQRRESVIGDVDAPPKKRKRTLAPTSSAGHNLIEGLRPHGDLLDSPWLTPKVWEELFDIYEKHFATDFPFLHRRRFLRPLHQGPPVDATFAKKGIDSLPRPPHDAPLLLAFLCVTARYHAELMSRFRLKPSTIAELFAEATRKELGDVLDGRPSLGKAQALLFLSFHEWTDMQGGKGWFKIGTVIRTVQVLGYQHDESRKNIDAPDDDDELAQQEAFIDREIQRRTVWSCFIIDRLASCGKRRPLGLNVADLDEIQLPCSDIAFSHGQKVQTRHLGESDSEYARRRQGVMDSIVRPREHTDGPRKDEHGSNGNDEIEWEVGKKEGGLSFYIQAVDHFGNVMKWSNSGGRRREIYVPWDSRSRFKKLEDDNLRLKAALPKHLILTPSNTDTHIFYKTSRVYLLIHALHSLCTIALYREYMAFEPWNVREPCGPLDEPRITEPPPDPNYWVNQARRCFGAAKDFADLLQPCRSANALVDGPFAGWTTYIVAWCALYCHFFPRMDPDHALDSRLQSSVWDNTHTIIIDLEDRFKIPSQWLNFLVRLHRRYKKKRAEWKAAGGSPGSTTSDGGGGLKDYSDLFESDQKEFGSLVNRTWNSKPVNRDDLKLQHEPDSEDRSEAPSPALVHKSEGTPAGWGTPVNKSSAETESTSETPAMLAQSQTSREHDPYSNVISDHAARNPTYNSHGVQPLQSLTNSHAALSSSYYPSSVSHAPVTPAGYDMYRTQNVATGAGIAHLGPQTYWQQQQGQQVPPDHQQISNLEAAGQQSVINNDLMSMQCAENSIGDPYDPYYSADFCWTGSIPQLPHGQTVWNGPPYDGSQGQMYAK